MDRPPKKTKGETLTWGSSLGGAPWELPHIQETGSNGFRSKVKLLLKNLAAAATNFMKIPELLQFINLDFIGPRNNISPHGKRGQNMFSA